MVSFNEAGFNMVTAELPNQDADSGLIADNLRCTVVEVRNEVPVLIIDGKGIEGRKPGGDAFHIYYVLDSIAGLRPELGTVTDLENGFHIDERKGRKLRRSLQDYPSIYLLNVPGNPRRAVATSPWELSEKAVKNLEEYVARGRSLAFFMGDRIRGSEGPEFYNRVLYKDGTGLFPAPLASKPARTLPGDADTPLTAEEREALANNKELKIFLRATKLEDAHPVLAGIYKYRELLRNLVIERYYPIDWHYKGTRYATGKGVEELMTLPNQESVEPFKVTAQELMNETIKLAESVPEYKKYLPALKTRHQPAVREALQNNLYQLAAALTDLLGDPGVANDPKQANITGFWKLPDQRIQDLGRKIDEFRQRIQYGDPLMIAKRYGKGKVVAFMTTAGKAWNNWAGGCLADRLYPVVMTDLQEYLGSISEEFNHSLGETVTVSKDAERYQPRGAAQVPERPARTRRRQGRSRGPRPATSDTRSERADF